MTDDVIKGQEGSNSHLLSLVYGTETRNRLIDDGTARKVGKYAEVHSCVVFATVGAVRSRRRLYRASSQATQRGCVLTLHTPLWIIVGMTECENSESRTNGELLLLAVLNLTAP